MSSDAPVATVPGQPAKPPTHLTSSQADRVWAFALHLDAEFTQRGNFFLVGESMLVVAYAAILTSTTTVADPASLSWIARAIGGFGVALAVIWAYTQNRQANYLRFVRQHLLDNFPEYAEIYAFRARRNFSTLVIMSYIVPGITATAWVTLILLS